MPTSIGPNGIESGLIFLLDAGNTKSYLSGSTSWTDLSGNNSAGTLVNNPTFDSSSAGSISFPGNNVFANFSVANIGTKITVEMWARLNSQVLSSKLLFGWNAYSAALLNTGAFGFNTGNSDVYGINYSTLNSKNLIDNWHHYVFVMNSGSYTSNKLYIDGELQTLSQQTGTANAAELGFNNGNGRIAGWRINSGSVEPSMNCSIFKIYNRELTSSEIAQSYKAVQSRYPGSVASDVTTSGLVLNLDAGNTNSYPGSGATWTDLTANANNVTLTNSPTFNSSNGGSIVFNGSTQYADFYAPNLGTTTTVEVWANVGSINAGKMIFGWNAYDAYFDNNGFGYNTGNGDIYGVNSSTVTSLGLIGNWKHYIFEMRSDVAYTNNKIYINGVAQSLSQIVSTESAAARNFNSGQGRIAGWRAGTSTLIQMNCSVFRVYNRALTQTEINKNFTLLRFRYGV